MGNFCKAENGNLRFFEAEIGIQTWAETEKSGDHPSRNDRELVFASSRNSSGNPTRCGNAMTSWDVSVMSSLSSSSCFQYFVRYLLSMKVLKIMKICPDFHRQIDVLWWYYLRHKVSSTGVFWSISEVFSFVDILYYKILYIIYYKITHTDLT